MISEFLFSGQLCGDISTNFTGVNSSVLLIGVSKGPRLKYYRYVLTLKRAETQFIASLAHTKIIKITQK